MVYFTLLNYSNQVWVQLSDNQLHKIQTLQNKAIHIINFTDYRASASPLYRKSKILSVSHCACSKPLTSFLLVCSVENIYSNKAY